MDQGPGTGEKKGDKNIKQSLPYILWLSLGRHCTRFCGCGCGLDGNRSNRTLFAPKFQVTASFKTLNVALIGRRLQERDPPEEGPRFLWFTSSATFYCTLLAS